MFPRLSLLILLTSIGLPGVLVRAAQPDLSVVENWLATHRSLESLEIDFIQKRKLRTLKIPLRSEGSLWLDFSDRQFRWQVGDPPKTIAVSDGDRLTIVKPQLKRVQFRPLGGSAGDNGAPPGFSSMTGGMPKTLEKFREQYRILGIEKDDDTYRIRTQPLGSPAARGVREFTFIVDAERFFLRGFKLELKDNSEIETDFTRLVRNVDIPDSRFTVDTDGYKEIEPEDS